MGGIVIGFIQWQIDSSLAYIKFVVGAFIAFLCVIIKTKFFTSGWKKLSKYDELFLFLKPLPFGLSVFNGIVSMVSPYSGNIFPSILFLTTNKCVMKIQQRWALENPFNSVHAVALANLGEQASGIMVLTALQYSSYRGIVTKIESEYLKKAKGELTAVSELDFLFSEISEEKVEKRVSTVIVDKSSAIVAKVICSWTFSKREPKRSDKVKE